MGEELNIDVPTEVRIVKKADDPLGAVRVAVGGMPGAYYCVYRGNKEAAIAALQAALTAMKAMAEYMGDREPDIAADDGKRYA
jgi:hypothetical protein